MIFFASLLFPGHEVQDMHSPQNANHQYAYFFSPYSLRIGFGLSYDMIVMPSPHEILP